MKWIALPAIALATTLPAQQPPKPAGPSRATVADLGAGQSVRIGSQEVVRPFGGTLVDRIATVQSLRLSGTRYHLVRGTPGEGCAARYVVVAQSVRGALRTSAPFGTCADGARLQIRQNVVEAVMPDPVTGAPVRYRWANGSMVPDAATLAAQAAIPGRPVAPACPSPLAFDPAAQARVIATFERAYPVEYRRLSTLKKTAIAPGALRAILVDLSCLWTWPGAERVIPDTAVPLFASRHGPAAFAELERLARHSEGGVYLQAAARSFGAEMRYRVARRTTI